MVRWLSRETFKLETEVLTKIPGILEIIGVVLGAEVWVYNFTFPRIERTNTFLLLLKIFVFGKRCILVKNFPVCITITKFNKKFA